VLTNLTFKSPGRPRPVMVTEFNGPWHFMPWWIRAACGQLLVLLRRGATAFWTYAPAAHCRVAAFV
jgi:hypothetical protein